MIGVPPIKIVFGGAIEPDRFMCRWPTVIPADSECKGAIEGITEGERRMIVADYIEHLVEMQKQITKTAIKRASGSLFEAKGEVQVACPG